MAAVAGVTLADVERMARENQITRELIRDRVMATAADETSTEFLAVSLSLITVGLEMIASLHPAVRDKVATSVISTADGLYVAAKGSVDQVRWRISSGGTA